MRTPVIFGIRYDSVPREATQTYEDQIGKKRGHAGTRPASWPVFKGLKRGHGPKVRAREDESKEELTGRNTDQTVHERGKDGWWELSRGTGASENVSEITNYFLWQ